MNTYYVYIMANKAGATYVGVTDDLKARVQEHRSLTGGIETRRNKMTKLVYYETTPSVQVAVDRERVLKTMARAHQHALVTQVNPQWEDLEVA